MRQERALNLQTESPAYQTTTGRDRRKFSPFINRLPGRRRSHVEIGPEPGCDKLRLSPVGEGRGKVSGKPLKQNITETTAKSFNERIGYLTNTSSILLSFSPVKVLLTV